MAKKKRRVFQHIMESESMKVLLDLLPPEWVVHEYKPDYGIDVVVEVFKYLEDDPDTAETLGEQFFVQLKSLRSTKIEKIVVGSRFNVELSELRRSGPETAEIEVVKFDLDVVELNTVRAMGAGLPVLLVLVALDLRRAFFVCLNDVIDKVIIPEDANFHEKRFKTIYVPVRNEIKNRPTNLVPIRFYAKRAKLLAAFNKFEFQRSVLLKFEAAHQPVDETVKHFLRILLAMDIWQDCEMWPIMAYYQVRLWKLSLLLSFPAITFENLQRDVNELWKGLVALGHNFEEICREWCLPTYLAHLGSYPDGQAVADAPLPLRSAKLFYPIDPKESPSAPVPVGRFLRENGIRYSVEL